MDQRKFSPLTPEAKTRKLSPITEQCLTYPPSFPPSSEMIPASFSESSSLAARAQKRKAHELDPVAIYKHVMQRLRQEHLFAAHEEDDWNAVTAKMLEDPSLPKPILSRPFTDANLFYNEIFGSEPVTEIYAAEDMNPSAPVDPTYEAAATALEQNVLWQGVREHINEASCRTAIDMVVLTAVDLAQKEIEEHTGVDDSEARRANHSLSDLKSSFSGGPQVHSWVVLHQEVSISDQQMLPSLALHGIIDYLLEVISAIDDDDFFMRREGMSDRLLSGLLSILEAKSDSTFHSAKSWGQRRSTRLSAKASPADPKVAPFTTARTPVYNIAEYRDLAVVLRLLTTSILSAAEDFERLAAGAPYII
ncbi:hypothetical protein K438DRAFT_1945554 [Mycena galopus ATCC 62051]|nr:hypothetical protein K438DRAFT_1945554 [Mycena galopus ATCC 62051]